VTDAPDLAGWAARYATAGLAGLPLHSIRGDGRCTCGRADCHSPGKHPLTRHGKDDASLDPGQLSEWWGRWPWANVGARPPAGIVVLDVDPRHGGDVELHRLTEQRGRLPETLTATTGSGGLHIWLAYRGPARGVLCTGVDVKTERGYLVMPPSLHVSGLRYRWVNEAPTAPAPSWVRRLLAPPPSLRLPVAEVPGGITPLVQFVSESLDGELNKRLFWACCRACERGLDAEPLIAAAVAKGHPERAARRTAASAGNRPSRKAEVR
jgi:hypothetical protein